MSANPRKKQSARDRLRGMVDTHVSVLDQERPAGPSDLASTIENADVRVALRRNRQYGDLPLEMIAPDPEQVRRVDVAGDAFRELVDSVREHGVIEPITVRWMEEIGLFHVVTGERRFRAAKQLGLETIPAIVRDLSDTKKAVHQLVENLQRENMNPIEEAKAFRRYLAATGHTMQQLAKEIGKSRVYVSQIMSILEKLTREEQDELGQRQTSDLPGKSLVLEALRLDDAKTRYAILSGNLTVREAREKVKAEKQAPTPGRKKFATKTFTLQEPAATVTVRLKQPKLDEDLVLEILRSAVKAQAKAINKEAKA